MNKEAGRGFSVLNKGTTGTIFITSLVWRGSWLGIEPETIPLGYRGGGTKQAILENCIICSEHLKTSKSITFKWQNLTKMSTNQVIELFEQTIN